MGSVELSSEPKAKSSAVDGSKPPHNPKLDTIFNIPAIDSADIVVPSMAKDKIGARCRKNKGPILKPELKMIGGKSAMKKISGLKDNRA